MRPSSDPSHASSLPPVSRRTWLRQQGQQAQRWAGLGAAAAFGLPAMANTPQAPVPPPFPPLVDPVTDPVPVPQAAGALPPQLPLRPSYTVTTQGKTAGHLRLRLEGQALLVDFSFRENGRGPDLLERIELDAQGHPTAYAGKGVSTFGAAIAEQFRFDASGPGATVTAAAVPSAQRVRWVSRVDAGDEPAQAGQIFLPLESSPAYLGLVAHRVHGGLASGATAVPLTGSGVGARVQVAHRMSLPTAEGPLALELWALEGLDIAPLWVWMQAGPQPRWFGVVEGMWAVLPDDLGSHAPTLLQAQAQAQESRLQRLQRQLTRTLPGLTLVAGVRWFDAPKGQLQGPSDVWLLDGRIRSITAPGALRDQPETRIDGQGRVLIPGLMDLHAHVLRPDLLLNLAFGVTTVRDMGNENADLLRIRASLDQGQLLGPRVVPLGFIEGASPFAASGGIVAKSLQEAKDAADWYHARGVRQLKLYNSIKPEWVAPLVAHAKAKGMKVGGHVPAFMRAEEVVRAGYAEISHINQVMLNFVVRKGDDTRTLQRFTRVGDDAHGVALNSPQAQAFLQLLGRKRTVVDPTLVAFEAMYTQQQGQFSPSYVDVQDHVPATWRRRLRVAELDLAGPVLRTYRGSWSRLLALTAALHRAGAVVVPGTDSISGLGLHRELALLVEAGLTPAQALQSATWVSAQVCGVQHTTGRIAPGLAADLVLIDGNPLEDITALRKASLVVRGSVALEPAAVLEALGFKPWVQGALGQG